VSEQNGKGFDLFRARRHKNTLTYIKPGELDNRQNDLGWAGTSRYNHNIILSRHTMMLARRTNTAEWCAPMIYNYVFVNIFHHTAVKPPSGHPSEIGPTTSYYIIITSRRR